MIQVIRPITIALKGKGPIALMKRVGSITKRYGVNAGKMDRALNQLSRLLQEFDCRGTFPITAVALARNRAVIQKYQAQGIEFAIHGYRHIDYSQLSQEEQVVHIRKANQIFQEQGIHCEGFRCPYLRWNKETLTTLSKVSLAYDSSNSLVWNIDERHYTDSYHRAIEFYGAQSAGDYPAIPRLDVETNLVRIPYCLPDDESLIERLVWRSSAEMNAIWPAMFREIHQQGELFNLGLHPERTIECAEGLRATMQVIHAIAPEVWRARLDEIAQWWQKRYYTQIDVIKMNDHQLQLSINGPKGTTLLLRSLEAKTATVPWFDNYQRASEIPCVIQTDKRPFIGVSPESAPYLASFLKQQGYIVEISSEATSYSLYLDRPTFPREKERSLIAQIEGQSVPLARLGRWPHGTRSAFCVTGDIDALTVLDYALRFIGY